MSKGLSMRVHHPTLGNGTVEGMDYSNRNGGFLRIRFDKDDKIRFFCCGRERFVASVQDAVIERW